MDKSVPTGFRQIKGCLQSAPNLRPAADYTDLVNRPLIMAVDAGPIGEGSWLGQNDEEGNRYAVVFFSGLFNKYELNYSQIKREACALVRNLHRMVPYIDGAPFIIVEIDAWSLKGIINNPTITDKTMLRWITYIMTFNIKFKFVKGKDNVIADALSRIEEVPTEESNTSNDGEEVEKKIDRLLQLATLTGPTYTDRYRVLSTVFLVRENLYEDDPWILEIAKFLDTLLDPEGFTQEQSRSLKRAASKFFLKDGYLFRREKGDGIPRKVVTNREQQIIIITEAHEGDSGVHFGFEGTYYAVKRRYYWRGMYDNIRQFTSSCVSCQLRSNLKFKEEAIPTSAPTLALIVWHCDLVHPGDGINGYKYLFHMVCALTGWCEGHPCKNKALTGIMNWAVDNVFRQYGHPIELVVDGGEFSSAEAREVAGRFGFQIRVVTAYHQQANAIVERAHKPLMDAIAKASQPNPRQWPNHVTRALFACRVTTGKRGYSPYELVFGQQPLFKLDIIESSFAHINWNDNMTTAELLAARMIQLERRVDDIERAKEILDEPHRVACDNLNRNNAHQMRSEPLKIGDWVLLWDSTLDKQWSRKLDNRWMGPFIVSEIRTGGIYRIRELNGALKASMYPGERLKKFIHRHEPDKDLYLGSIEEQASDEDDISIVVELDVPSDFDNDDEDDLLNFQFSHQLKPVPCGLESAKLGFIKGAGIDA